MSNLGAWEGESVLTRDKVQGRLSGSVCRTWDSWSRGCELEFPLGIEST